MRSNKLFFILLSVIFLFSCGKKEIVNDSAVEEKTNQPNSNTGSLIQSDKKKTLVLKTVALKTTRPLTYIRLNSIDSESKNFINKVDGIPDIISKTFLLGIPVVGSKVLMQMKLNFKKWSNTGCDSSKKNTANFYLINSKKKVIREIFDGKEDEAIKLGHYSIKAEIMNVGRCQSVLYTFGVTIR